jgi:hypothetical protein
MKMIKLFAALVAAGCISSLFTSCIKDELPLDAVVDSTQKSSEKAITHFYIRKSDSSDLDNPYTVKIWPDTISFIFPIGTDLHALRTEVQFKGASIDPPSGAILDFSKPFELTITAEDSSTRKYVVVASIEPLQAIYFGDEAGN